MQELLEGLKSHGEALGTSVQTLLATLGALPQEVRDWANNGTLALSEAASRTGTLGSLVVDLGNQPAERFALVPYNRLATLRDQTAQLAASADGMNSALANLESWGGVARFETANGNIHTTSGNPIGLGAHLREIQPRLDNALESYLIVSAAVQPRGVGTFAAASRLLSNKATEATEVVSSLQKTFLEWANSVEVAAGDIQSIKVSRDEAQRILEQVEKDRRTVDEDTAKATAAAATIEAVRAQAATLETSVSNYQAQFDGFQEELDRREASIRHGDQAVKDLQAKLTAKESAITSLTAKAEEMLGGATTAGLASAYKAQADAVDIQLTNARRWYYGAIVLLVVSVAVALNLLAPFHVTLPSLPTLDSKTPTGTIAVQALSALGSRGLLVLPALLLAGFTAHRHSTLFRLREEYSHKYAAAASVQGFKLQAPSFDEQIAAAVFAELLKNPAAAMDGHSHARTNGFVDRLLMPRIQEALKRAAQFPEVKEGNP